MKYIDIHGHLNFAVFDPDREDAIGRAAEAGVDMITVGTQIETSRAAVELARGRKGMYAAVGLHPVHTGASQYDCQEFGESDKEFTSRGETVDIQSYIDLACDPKVVAIGECGLDYYHPAEESIEKQRRAFEAMIDVANEVEKPLMLHIRNSKKTGTSAYRDALEILRARAKVGGNVHFFAGSVEEARLFLDIGYSLSFTGVITFARNYDEVVRFVPLDRIMAETDCPYVTPEPYRGRRNEPAYVVEIVKAISKIKNLPEKETAGRIVINAEKTFRIS